MPRAEVVLEYASRLPLTERSSNSLTPVLAWQSVQKPNLGSICQQNYFVEKDFKRVVSQGIHNNGYRVFQLEEVISRTLV